jgi:hypothetical protein
MNSRCQSNDDGLHSVNSVAIQSDSRPRRGARAEPGGRVACVSCHRLHVASSRAGVKWESTPQSPSLTPLPPPFHRPQAR